MPTFKDTGDEEEDEEEEQGMSMEDLEKLKQQLKSEHYKETEAERYEDTKIEL